MCNLPQVKVFALLTMFAALLVFTGCGGGFSPTAICNLQAAARPAAGRRRTLTSP